MSRYDVAVVGTGLAGLSTAVRLAESGARVVVLAKGVGATHLSGATIDVLGYAPERVDSPAEALGAFVSSHPDHPYAHVGADGIAAAIEWFKERVATGSLAPYSYAGDGSQNLLLPSAIGVPRPSAVVPETMAGGDLRSDAPVLVVGLRALKDFHPALLADMLERSDTGVSARSVELDVLPEGRVDSSSLAFARAFDQPAFRGEVVNEITARLRPNERIAFPAVLGIADPHTAWAELERGTGRPVFEVPTLPPGVPGMRLFAILREALRRAGGRVLLNNVVFGADDDGGRVRTLRVRVGLREERYDVDWVVLATGGFAAGGLTLDSRWTARETALGLPVTGVPGSGAARFVPGYFDEQPMARAGVATDRELRPVDAAGDRVYENVLVVGATLAGAEPWREKSGDGISLATGHRAAELILAAATSLTSAPAAATGG